MAIHPQNLDGVFQALADPTRRAMLGMLARGGETTAGELGQPFRISQPAASKHIRILERAGLVSREVGGRVHRLRLVEKPLREAESWIARHRKFWEGSLEQLDQFLEQKQKERS